MSNWKDELEDGNDEVDDALRRRLIRGLEHYADNMAGDGWEMFEDVDGDPVAVLPVEDTDQFPDPLAIGVAVVGDGYVGLSGYMGDDDIFRIREPHCEIVPSVPEAAWAARVGFAERLQAVIGHGLYGTRTRETVQNE